MFLFVLGKSGQSYTHTHLYHRVPEVINRQILPGGGPGKPRITHLILYSRSVFDCCQKAFRE